MDIRYLRPLTPSIFIKNLYNVNVDEILRKDHLGVDNNNFFLQNVNYEYTFLIFDLQKRRFSIISDTASISLTSTDSIHIRYKY